MLARQTQHTDDFTAKLCVAVIAVGVFGEAHNYLFVFVGSTQFIGRNQNIVVDTATIGNYQKLIALLLQRTYNFGFSPFGNAHHAANNAPGCLPGAALPRIAEGNDPNHIAVDSPTKIFGRNPDVIVSIPVAVFGHNKRKLGIDVLDFSENSILVLVELVPAIGQLREPTFFVQFADDGCYQHFQLPVIPVPDGIEVLDHVHRAPLANVIDLKKGGNVVLQFIEGRGGSSEARRSCRTGFSSVITPAVAALLLPSSRW